MLHVMLTDSTGESDIQLDMTISPMSTINNNQFTDADYVSMVQAMAASEGVTNVLGSSPATIAFINVDEQRAITIE